VCWLVFAINLYSSPRTDEFSADVIAGGGQCHPQRTGHLEEYILSLVI
jgi:hypothetical protein